MFFGVDPLALALFGPALVINALSAYHVFKLQAALAPKPDRPAAKVSVILPVTGPQPGLAELLEALARQTPCPRRVLICVESEDDPAFAAANRVAQASAIKIEVIVAGLATLSAQKCKNQLAGLARVDAQDDVIVFIDGDILPSDGWLGWLIGPLYRKKAEIVTAYRWHRPVFRLGAQIVANIDRAVLLTPRVEWGPAQLAWGGSMALTPETARRLDLATVWSRTLSDDVSLSHAASQNNARIMTRPVLGCSTRTTFGVLSGWAFARRQYQMAWIYRPEVACCSLAIIGFRLLGWGAAIWIAPSALTPAALLAGLALAKQFVMNRIDRRLEPPAPSRTTPLAQLALALFQPIVDLFHFAVTLAAIRTRSVTWGHVRYQVNAGDDIIVIGRRGWNG